jgi:hypothetical protein
MLQSHVTILIRLLVNAKTLSTEDVMEMETILKRRRPARKNAWLKVIDK